VKTSCHPAEKVDEILVFVPVKRLDEHMSSGQAENSIPIFQFYSFPIFSSRT